MTGGLDTEVSQGQVLLQVIIWHIEATITSYAPALENPRSKYRLVVRPQFGDMALKIARVTANHERLEPVLPVEEQDRGGCLSDSGQVRLWWGRTLSFARSGALDTSGISAGSLR